MNLPTNDLFGQLFTPFLGCAAHVGWLRSAARLQNEVKIHPKPLFAELKLICE